jgi:hypothetical protein
VTLLDKYNKDKQTSGVVDCDCHHTQECKKEHNNLYEAAFCELRNYAMNSIEEGEKKKEEYNETLHKKIMRLVEEVFRTTTLFVEWNMYIETLLREIHSTNMHMDPKPLRKKPPTRTRPSSRTLKNKK